MKEESPSFRTRSVNKPQLSQQQQLINLRSELTGQVRPRVLMHHGAEVNQQPGISPPQFDLGSIEQVEHDIGD